MREIRGYIISILTTIIFFMISTIVWYKLHLNYENVQKTLNNLNEIYVLEEVTLSDLEKISDKKATNIKCYRLVLNNYDAVTKKISIKLIDDYYGDYNSNYKIDNNYLRYMIKKDNGSYSNIRSLNMNGEIYIDNLESNTQSVYEIKVWVSNNYQNEVNYHGNFVVVYL